MKLYLSSEKLGNQENELKKWLKSHPNKILLITNARDAKPQDEIEKNKIKQNIKMLEIVGFQVTALDLRLYINNYAKLKKDIKNYFAFCVIGGNVFVLREAMKLSGFDIILKELSNNNDYLYIGYSAGSCVLAKNLEGLEFIDEPISLYHNSIIYEGVGLIDYRIVPHYKSQNKKSSLIDDIVSHYEKNFIKFQTLKDGEVIIEEL